MSDYMLEKERITTTSARPPGVSSDVPEDYGCHVPGSDEELDVATSIICSMLFVFGVVYCLFGYRCFKAVMFLTGFMFGSVVVYLICQEESLLPTFGNAGVAIGAGILFGLVTMLVQYVGLFMTGFHSGLLTGVVVVLVMDTFRRPATVWVTVGILIGCGLLLAVLTLYWQKGLTVLGTSLYGGAVMAASLDYFVERFLMMHWVWDKVKVAPFITKPTCWLSWVLLAVWPLAVAVGIAIQVAVTGRGTYHQQTLPSRKSRQANASRLRNRQTGENQQQRRFRYLYQVRTAHGDVISQSYIQSLQHKVSPAHHCSSSVRSDATPGTSFNQPPESTETTMTRVPWDKV